MATREQNWDTIEELQPIIGYDSVGNNLILREILN